VPEQEKEAGCKRAHARGEKKGAGKEFVGKGFILLMEAVPIPGRVTLTPASERSEHR